MALGIMTVLAISGTTIVYFTSSSARTASRSSSDQKAYAFAEAGLNDALSILENASNPTVSTLLPQTVASFEGGSATYSGTIDSNYVWTITSIGSVRSPSGALSNVRRTLKQSVQVLGLNATSKTTENMIRTGQCVLNLPSVNNVAAVNRLARLTGEVLFEGTGRFAGLELNGDLDHLIG